MTNKSVAVLLSVLAICSTRVDAAQVSDADKFPVKPVRYIIPFPPGAGSDLTARTIAQKLSEIWKVQVIADNRTGASGVIGVEATANANPDGYTICHVTASHTTNAATNPKLPYDLNRDLQGVTQATSLYYVLYTSSTLPAKSVKELVAYAKANPGRLNYGSSGIGGLQHFAGELFAELAGIKMVHVPYKGSGAVIPAMLGGEVQLGFGSIYGVRSLVQQGKLKWLAITAAKRSPAVDLPTIAEAGLPGYEVDQWYGVVASAKVPKPVIQKINASIRQALKSPDVVQRLTSDGATIVGSAPEEFSGYMKAEITKWKKLVKDANISLQQ